MSTPTVNLSEAAKLLGFSKSTAYKLAHDGEFPTRVIKAGSRFFVPTKPLLDLLGLEELPEENEAA